MKLKETFTRISRNSSLAAKIRFSYFLIMVPILVLLGISIFALNSEKTRSENLIDAAVAASDFSLDFKKDFDYETYLVIAGNKTLAGSKLDQLLGDARQIVSELSGLTDPGPNLDRLKSASKYLDNLKTYRDRIEANLKTGNLYEVNMRIWENDVQVVTGLIHETLMEYIYYEIRGIQDNKEANERVNVLVIETIFGSAIFLILLASLLSYYIPLGISRPVKELSQVMDQVARGNLSVHNEVRGGLEVNSLSESLNTMIDKINLLLAQVTQEQMELRKAELELLQSQINPHFLYNTLDTIMWLAEAGQMQEVVSMVDSLSNFFRTSLNQGKEIVTLKEEIRHVRAYLEIQQVRYQDILEYEIQVPEALMDFQIPKITLQPLVENALYHGIKNKRGLGKISISGDFAENGKLSLFVRDNGIGMGHDQLDKLETQLHLGSKADSQGFGLYNVNERIRLKFGEDYGLSLSSKEGEGTLVEVRLPGLRLES